MGKHLPLCHTASHYISQQRFSFQSERCEHSDKQPWCGGNDPQMVTISEKVLLQITCQAKYHIYLKYLGTLNTTILECAPYRYSLYILLLKSVLIQFSWLENPADQDQHCFYSVCKVKTKSCGEVVYKKISNNMSQMDHTQTMM